MLYTIICYMFIPTSIMAYSALAKKDSSIPGNLGICLTYHPRNLIARLISLLAKKMPKQITKIYRKN